MVQKVMIHHLVEVDKKPHFLMRHLWFLQIKRNTLTIW
ncbi:hypothetical protein L579_4282 [Pantoea sp. AS-PWVM4]|nr:hypothetical protein L579_4282 [Pantoea sp. AS-PWVM4]